MRRLALAAGLVLAASFVVLAIAVPSVLSLRRDLDDGRRALLQARAALAGGDPASARERFASSERAFTNAVDTTSSPGLSIVSVVPFLGRSVDAARALGDGGSLTARAGGVVTNALEELGGFDAFATQDGRIPFEPITALASAVSEAAPLLERARSAVAASPSSPLPGPIADARADALGALEDAVGTARSTNSILDRLPSMLGADGPRVYFVGAEDPAELRGSGGLIGAFALLRFDGGRMELSRFSPVASLPDLEPSDVPAPSEEYSTLYDRDRQGGGFWFNANMTPDFPSAARAIESSYETATGQAIDGVITADPFALAALVRATGPAPVPELGMSVEADEVVPLLSNQGFALFDDQVERKRVLGDVARAILGRALGDVDADVVRHLLEALSERHVKVYSDDAAMQDALARTAAGGAFDVGPGDFVSVVENNAAANKLDFYEHRRVTYEVWLRPGGATSATTTVEVENATPDEPLPGRVLGEGDGAILDLPEGATRSLVNVYCAGCGLVDATADGTPLDVSGGTELGATFFQGDLTVPRGVTTMSVSWAAEDVWEDDGSSGSYLLTIHGQTTINPTPTRVVIHLPDGMSPSRMSDGMREDEDAVVWSGTPMGRLELEVSFDSGFPLGLWRDVTSVFD